FCCACIHYSIEYIPYSRTNLLHTRARGDLRLLKVGSGFASCLRHTPLALRGLGRPLRSGVRGRGRSLHFVPLPCPTARSLRHSPQTLLPQAARWRFARRL